MTPQHLAVIERAHVKAARIAVVDHRALPIFERLDREVKAAQISLQSRNSADPVASARALLAAAGLR